METTPSQTFRAVFILSLTELGLSASCANSGGTTHKSKLADNNVDLQKILEMVQALPEAVKLISFMIDGDTYQAEEGMTWYEWDNNDYNTGGFIIADVTEGPVCDSAYFYVANTSNNTIPEYDDIIVSNGVYRVNDDNAPG